MAELSKSKPTSTSKTKNLLDELTNLKREVYSNIDLALVCDQKLLIDSTVPDKLKTADYENAIFLYQKSLSLTEKALNYYNIHKETFSAENEAIQTATKLEAIRAQAIDRINTIRSNLNTLQASDIDMRFLDIGDNVLLDEDFDDLIVVENENEQSTSETKTNNEEADSRLETSKNHFQYVDSKKAIELFKLENVARMFYIGTDGSVTTPSNSKSISIYSFDQDNETANKKILGFIKCGDWMHPLLPNENPGMKTNFNAYIFPNNDSELNSHIVRADAECSFVGVTFSDVVSEQVTFFEDILKNFNSLVYQDTGKSTDVKVPVFNENLKSKTVVIDGADKKPKENFAISKPGVKETWSADNIAGGLVTGAEYVSKGLSTGTEYAVKYMGLGGEKLKTSLQPNAVPTKMSPAVKKSAEIVRSGTNMTVRVSGYLVNKLGSLVSATAKATAPTIRKGTTSLLTTTGISSNKEKATSTVDDICKVGGGGIKGIVMVWSTLEEAAITLGKNFTEQTVTVVDHKYGQEAADVTENGLYSVGNIAITVNNYKGLKLKKVGKTLLKETAKETVVLHKEQKALNPN